MRVKVDDTQEIETNTLSVEQLKQLRYEVEDAIDLIEHQIEMAKAVRVETGEFAPAQWMAKASYALTRKRRVSQRLMEEIGVRRKSDAVTNRPLSEYFVDICKEKMKKELFLSILDEAENRKSGLPEQEPA